MDKGNWTAIDKAAIKLLPKNRPCTTIEALFSLSVDVDCGKVKTPYQYSKLWSWSRGKAERFVVGLLENRGKDGGHTADTRGAHGGHKIRLINNKLRGTADTRRTHGGHTADNYYNPNPSNPNPSKQTTPPTPPGGNGRVEFLELFPIEFQVSEHFRKEWGLWLKHRKEKRSAITATTAEKQMKRLTAIPIEEAIAMLDYSADNGYTGLFEPKTNIRKSNIDQITLGAKHDRR